MGGGARRAKNQYSNVWEVYQKRGHTEHERNIQQIHILYCILIGKPKNRHQVMYVQVAMKRETHF